MRSTAAGRSRSCRKRRTRSYERGEPGTARLVDIVVGAAFPRIGDVGRIVREQEGPLVPVGGKIRLQPGRLFRFHGEARIDHRRVDDDQVQVLEIERVVVSAEVPFVEPEVSVVDRARRHPAHHLVAHVVISRHHVERRPELRGERLEVAGGLRVGRQLRHRIDDIPEVDHEGGRHLVQLGDDIACASVGQAVTGIGRGGIVLALVHVRIRHHCEGVNMFTCRSHSDPRVFHTAPRQRHRPSLKLVGLAAPLRGRP
jgi:hypothetical protein